MKNDAFDRRTFLKSAVAGSAAAVIGTLPQPARGKAHPQRSSKPERLSGISRKGV